MPREREATPRLSMASKRRTIPAPSMLPRLGSPLEWNTPQKCLLVAFPTLLFLMISIFGLSIYEDNPDMAPFVDRSYLAPFQWVLYAITVVWCVLIAAAAYMRKRIPRAQGLAHATIQLWHVSYALASYFVGPLTSPFGGLILVGALFGFLLFDARVELFGIASFLTIIAVTIVLERLGTIPYAPLLAEPPYVAGRLSGYWIFTMGSISIFISILVLSLFYHVIQQWRTGEALLDQLAKTDGLTETNNRRHFMELMSYEFGRAGRYGRELSLVLIDIDHFKRVNDTYGHPDGDAALVLVASILKDAVRRQDIVARYGGEEFALLLPETPRDAALIVAERCRSQIERAEFFSTDGEQIALTASFGVASHPHAEGATSSEMVRLADEALYRAKEGGRNRVVVSGSDVEAVSAAPATA